MKVTILVPVYGVEKYIGECAESLFSQTYEEIEYVFCNDCTKDDSIEVLQAVLEKHPERQSCVRIVNNEQNLGLGGTRVRLVSEIHTSYFMIVDSDDILPLNAVETLVRRMQQTDTDIVDAAYAEYAEGRVGERHLPSHDVGSRYLNKVLCNNLVSLRVWGKLYKTSVLNKIPDLFFQGIDYAEDLCATTRLAAVTTRSWTDEVVYLYRTDNMASYTQNISEKNILSYFRACKKILSFYHQRGHLPMSLEIGILNAYRECRKSGIAHEKADEIIRYVPEHMRASLLYKMFCNKSVPFAVADYLYRTLRTLAL